MARMTKSQPGAEHAPAVDAGQAEAVRRQVRKIAESDTFRRSRRSQEFLEYTVERALESRFEELKERVIGTTLFGRPPDYDTGSDSIVRVVANETRRRLQEYNRVEENYSPVRIELPPGSYMPLIQHVELPEPVVDDAPPATKIASPAPAVHARFPRPLGLTVALAVVLSAAVVVLWFQNRSLSSQLSGKKEASQEALVLPWSAMFEGNRGINILLADSSVGGIQNLLHRRLPLSDYANGKFLPDGHMVDQQTLAFVQFLEASQYTTASYATVAVRFAQLAQTFGVPARVSYARNISVRTFKGGDNFVVLGTSRANPWAQLFEPQLNFVVEFGDGRSLPAFRNRAPLAGESALYQASDAVRESYGYIAFLPSLYQGGDVLFVTGTGSQGTEAAGEFLSDLGRLRTELRKLGIRPESGPAKFEILMRVRELTGSPVRSEIVAWR
jgi:hypothetical protein